MKLIHLSSFLLCLLLISCQQAVSNHSETTKTTISGTIDNPVDADLKLFIDDEGVDLEVRDSSFTHAYESHEPQFVVIRYGKLNKTVFITPGKHVEMEIKMPAEASSGDEPSIVLQGDLVAENDFLVNTMSGFSLPPYRELYAMDEDAFLETLEKNKREAKKAMQEAQEEKAFSDEFAQLMESELIYRTALPLQNYESAHRYFTEDDAYQMSEKMVRTRGAIPLEAPGAILSPSYRSYVMAYIQNESWKSVKDDEEKKDDESAYTEAMVQLADSTFSDQSVRDLVYYQILNSGFWNGLQDQELEVYEQYMAESENELWKEKLRETKASWDKISPGTDAPIFAYPDINGKVVSLEDLKGKVVYIDVWATWCGPCIAEQPDLEKLEAQYHANPDVAFVGVSVDKDKDAWNKMVKNKEMGGYQLIADKAWESRIIKDYMISGIPRFILIDAEGRIIQPSAPRPSSGEVDELVNAALTGSAREALMLD